MLVDGHILAVQRDEDEVVPSELDDRSLPSTAATRGTCGAARARPAPYSAADLRDGLQELLADYYERTVDKLLRDVDRRGADVGGLVDLVEETHAIRPVRHVSVRRSGRCG